MLSYADSIIIGKLSGQYTKKTGPTGLIIHNYILSNDELSQIFNIEVSPNSIWDIQLDVQSNTNTNILVDNKIIFSERTYRANIIFIEKAKILNLDLPWPAIKVLVGTISLNNHFFILEWCDE